MVGITCQIDQGHRSKKILFSNEYSNVFYQNPQSELFKVWMALRMCWQRSLRVEALLQTLQAKRFYFSMNIQMCFIKINKVNSLNYEWSLDVLTEIFESWSFIANTKDQKVLFLNEYSNVLVSTFLILTGNIHTNFFVSILPGKFAVRLKTIDTNGKLCRFFNTLGVA